MFDDYSGVKNIGRFRYYCQKVLPAVYDDSLSYYELLTKVVEYLNEVIENDNQQNKAITELQETLLEFMSGEFDPYIEEKVDEWFEEHEPELYNIVEGLQTNMNYSTMYGGDGTLMFDIFDVNPKIQIMSTHNKISRDKSSNLIRFDIGIQNVSNGEYVQPYETLFKIKNFYMRRYQTLELSLNAQLYRFDADTFLNINNEVDYANRELESVTPARVRLYRDGDDALVQINFGILFARELMIIGDAPIASLFSWICSSFYNNELCNALCAYFLNGDGDTSWEGTFEYSTSNDYRLDPDNRKTDCSGMTYIAYKHFGFHPQNSVQQSYLTDGIFIAYAGVNEKLDLSNARPGDIICFQRADDPENYPVESYTSWTHCCIYAGNNVCYEMARWYPETETRAGCVDGYGPYRITTPADEYRMTGGLNPLTNHSFSGYNRCVVRFL